MRAYWQRYQGRDRHGQVRRHRPWRAWYTMRITRATTLRCCAWPRRRRVKQRRVVRAGKRRHTVGPRWRSVVKCPTPNTRHCWKTMRATASNSMIWPRRFQRAKRRYRYSARSATSPGKARRWPRTRCRWCGRCAMQMLMPPVSALLPSPRNCRPVQSWRAPTKPKPICVCSIAIVVKPLCGGKRQSHWLKNLTTTKRWRRRTIRSARRCFSSITHAAAKKCSPVCASLARSATAVPALQTPT